MNDKSLRVNFLIPQNSATRKALRDTIVACNSLAMSALGRGKTRRCKDLLARAFEIASDARLRGGNSSDRSPKQSEGGDIPPLQVLTLNNTACLHRRYSGWWTTRYSGLGRKIYRAGSVRRNKKCWLMSEITGNSRGICRRMA